MPKIETKMSLTHLTIPATQKPSESNFLSPQRKLACRETYLQPFPLADHAGACHLQLATVLTECSRHKANACCQKSSGTRRLLPGLRRQASRRSLSSLRSPGKSTDRCALLIDCPPSLVLDSRGAYPPSRPGSLTLAENTRLLPSSWSHKQHDLTMSTALTAAAYVTSLYSGASMPMNTKLYMD